MRTIAGISKQPKPRAVTLACRNFRDSDLLIECLKKKNFSFQELAERSRKSTQEINSRKGQIVCISRHQYSAVGVKDEFLGPLNQKKEEFKELLNKTPVETWMDDQAVKDFIEEFQKFQVTIQKWCEKQNENERRLRVDVEDPRAVGEVLSSEDAQREADDYENDTIMNRMTEKSMNYKESHLPIDLEMRRSKLNQEQPIPFEDMIPVRSMRKC